MKSLNNNKNTRSIALLIMCYLFIISLALFWAFETRVNNSQRTDPLSLSDRLLYRTVASNYWRYFREFQHWPYDQAVSIREWGRGVLEHESHAIKINKEGYFLDPYGNEIEVFLSPEGALVHTNGRNGVREVEGDLSDGRFNNLGDDVVLSFRFLDTTD